MSTGILNLTKDLRDYLWEKGMQKHPVLSETRQETSSNPINGYANFVQNREALNGKPELG
jgi:hypothetical protein